MANIAPMRVGAAAVAVTSRALQHVASRSSENGRAGIAATSATLPGSAATAPMFLMCVAVGSQRRLRARRSRASRAATLVEVEDAATLESQVAQLRAEVSVLEAEQAEKKRQEERMIFKAFDTDGSGAVDVVELQQGFKDLHGTDVDAEIVHRLLKEHDKNGDDVLQPEEFNIVQMQSTLAKWEMEEIVARREERERAQQAQQELEENPLANWPSDVEFPVRLASVLAYVLPLTSCLRFFPLSMRTAAVQQFLLPAILPAQLVTAVPFGMGPFALFLGMQVLSENRKVPLPLRFNLRQAVVLDIMTGFFQLFGGLANLSAQNQIPPNVSDVCSVLCFLIVASCVMYSAASSLLGAAPDNIPVVSDYARRTIRRENADDDSDASPV